MTFTAKIRVTLRPSILDPQGKAAHHALHQLGFHGVTDVRMGKYIEVRLEATSAEEARRVVAEAAAKLLSNAVMEDVTFELEEGVG
jgi:phosphoribosylformylglycinamidine synthase